MSGQRILFLRTVAVLFFTHTLAAFAGDVVFRDAKELARLPAPVQEWYRMETQLLSRQLRPGVFAPIDQNPQNVNFTPESARVFELNGYWIPEQDLKTYESVHDPALLGGFHRTRNGKGEILFLVHPESENFYAKLGLEKMDREVFLAAATASSRSLLVWREAAPEKPLIAKLSLDAVIGTVDRTISGKETAASIGVDRLLGQMYDLPSTFEYFHEEFGAIPKGMERGGMILRSFPTSRNLKDILIPFFSLAMTPADGSLPLVLRMAKAAGEDPRHFITEKIIRPFVAQWADLAIEHGVLMEPHGQNILLEVTSGLSPTGRIVHRDFGGFNIDLAYVKKQYLVSTANLPLFSKTIADNYYQDAHLQNMSKSIDVYFGDGVLYSYEKNWPEWAQKGWVKDSENFSAKAIMMELLQRELSQRAGYSVFLGDHFSNLSSIVLKLRNAVVKPKSHWFHCRSVFQTVKNFLHLR